MASESACHGQDMSQLGVRPELMYTDNFRAEKLLTRPEPKCLLST